MSVESNKALVQRWITEFFNQGKLELADEMFAPEFVQHDPGTPGDFRGPEGAKRYVETYRTGFPDVTLTIEDMVAEGDKVVTRWSGRGTHTGDLPGLPATGKTVNVSGIQIDRFANGKVVENYLVWDALGMLQQIGVIPAPGGA